MKWFLATVFAVTGVVGSSHTPQLAAAEPDWGSQIRAAPRLETEDLCEPVKSVREGMLLWAPNPDGKTWDLLQIYFPQYGGPNTIVVIDLGSGEVKQIQTERGWNFHLCPSVVAPNGKLFISILNQRLQQEICTYDPAANELKLAAVDMPDELLGETHPLVLGTDGKLYAIGQHPSRAAAAAQIDPDTLQVAFYGPIGPSHEPNACWGYSGAADDRFVYIASGKIPWYLVAYDRQTGQAKTLVETATVGGHVSVGQRADGCVGSASGIVHRDVQRADYWLYQGQAIPKQASGQTPPWPPRESRRTEPPRPEVNTGLAVPDLDGWAEIWVRTAEAKAAVNVGTPPVATVGSETQPTARVGSETQPTPEQLGWRRFRFQVPLYAHSIYRLMELPDGRLFGTAGAYEGNFVYDPKSGDYKHLGKIQLSHYATAFAGGKIYMSGYPTSPLYVYDPQEPWTAGTFVQNRVIQDAQPEANPRMLLLMGEKSLAGTHKMYAAASGAGGKVYFGGAWIRDGACGGIAWYDPATGAARGMWQPLSNYQVTHLAAVDEGRVVVLSTRRVDDSVLGKPKPEQGALWFLDTQKEELTGKFEPVPLAKGSGPIVAVGDSRIVGWTENPQDAKASILYALDVRGPKLLYRHDLPFPLPVAIGSNQQEAWDFRLGPDGQIWTFIDGTLVRIAPADGTIQVVGRPNQPGRLAFADGRVYLGGSTSIRRIRD